MTQINITRNGGAVSFEEVSIDVTGTVFFTNQDSVSAHWPTLATNQVGAAPSANSSQCIVTLPNQQPAPLPYLGPPYPLQIKYGCQIPGHQNERGVINVYNMLTGPLGSKSKPIPNPVALQQATQGTPIAAQSVVLGGKPPYSISNQLFQIFGGNGSVIQSGSGVGPGLQLTLTPPPGTPVPDKTNTVIWLIGTPTVVGTYNFTFEVNDGMGGNLQQVQYTMVVVARAGSPIAA